MLIRVVGSYCAKFQIGQAFDCQQYRDQCVCLPVRSFKLTSVPSTSKTSEFESKRLLSDAVYFLKKLNLKGKSHELGVCEPKHNA